MRKKRRYIAFETVENASTSDVLQTIGSLRATWPSAERYMLKLVLHNEHSRQGLLRCGHKQVEEIKALMTGVEKLGAKAVSFRTLGVSGTIKAAKRKFLTTC